MGPGEQGCNFIDESSHDALLIGEKEMQCIELLARPLSIEYFALNNVKVCLRMSIYITQ